MKSESIKSPQIVNLVNTAPGFSEKRQFTKESIQAMDRLIDAMRPIRNENAGKQDNDVLQSIWIKVERGSEKDFGDYEEMKESGDVESYEEFRELWDYYCPRDPDWFLIQAITSSYGNAVFINGKRVIDSTRDTVVCDWGCDISGVIGLIAEKVSDTVEMMKDGTYEDMMSAIPHEFRRGTILREEYWKIFPDEKERYLDGISDKDIDDFERFLNDRQARDAKDITANDFYRFCRTAYESAGYGSRIKGMSAKEAYYRMADGRDEGLTDIQPDSAEAFRDWLEHRKRGGHPWEVFGGGPYIGCGIDSSTGRESISVWGNYYGQRREAVLSYLGLRRAGIHARFIDGKRILESLRGKDRIGIVPLTENENMLDGYDGVLESIHLPDEKKERMTACIKWSDMEVQSLETANSMPER